MITSFFNGYVLCVSLLALLFTAIPVYASGASHSLKIFIDSVDIEITPLLEEQIVDVVVPLNSFKYFSFTANYSKAQIIFSGTPASGQVKIYLSSVLPTLTNYQWVSNDEPVIHLNYTDTNFNSSGTYYLGVFGTQQAVVQVQVQVRDISSVTPCNEDSVSCPFVELSLAEPQLGALSLPEEYLYYQLSLQDFREATLTFSLDSDLVIMYIRNDGQLPTSNSTQWSATGSVDVPGCTSCSYIVLVTSPRVDSLIVFTIQVTQAPSTTPLVNGISQFVHTSTNWTFFSYIAHSGEQLMIFGTSITGDLDIFVTDELLLPNKSNSRWSVIGLGSKVLTIDAPSNGSYYIGINTESNVACLITASQGPLTLIDGYPYEDKLPDSGVRSFTVDVEGTNKSSILFLNPRLGTPHIKVARVSNPSTILWSTLDPSKTLAHNSLIIPSVCTRCSYLITIESGPQDSIYSLVYFKDAKSILLQAERPFEGMISDEPFYFRTEMDLVTTDLTLIITLFVGSVDVFISTFELPSRESFNWTFSASSTGALLRVPGDSSGNARLYISVSAKIEARYSITVRRNNRHIFIPLGRPVFDVCSNPANYYILEGDLDGKDISFQIRFHSNPSVSSVELYVNSVGSVEPTGSPQLFPDHGSSLWEATLSEGQIFTIRKADPLRCTACVYSIAIVGKKCEEYSFIASSEDTAIVLPTDLFPFSGFLSALQSQYFESYTPPFTATTSYAVVVTLETCKGNADLYVSQNNYHPNPYLSDTFSESSKEQYEDDVVRVIFATPNRLADLYITVYGVQDSEYLLSVANDSTSHNLFSTFIQVASLENALLITIPRLASSFEPEAIRYLLYVEEDISNSSFSFYSACGLAHFEPKLSLTEVNGKIETMLKGLNPSIRYKLNAVALDPNGKRVSYTPKFGVRTSQNSEINGDAGGESIPKQLDTSTLALLIVGLFAALALIIFLVFYCSNKRVVPEHGLVPAEIEVPEPSVNADAVAETLRSGTAGHPSNYREVIEEDIVDDPESDDEGSAPKMRHAQRLFSPNTQTELSEDTTDEYKDDTFFRDPVISIQNRSIRECDEPNSS